MILKAIPMPSAAASFFCNDTATTEIYTLSLHDALPICLPAPHAAPGRAHRHVPRRAHAEAQRARHLHRRQALGGRGAHRSEEHTSELQSRQYLVGGLLLEKKTKYSQNVSLIYSLCLDSA